MFTKNAGALLCAFLALTDASFVNLSIEKKWFDESKQITDEKPHYVMTNENKLVKRDSPDAVFDIETKFNQLMYQVNLDIGSNKDPVILLLDTGSSDLIINSKQNAFCFADNNDEGDDSDGDNDDNDDNEDEDDDDDNSEDSNIKKRDLSASGYVCYSSSEKKHSPKHSNKTTKSKTSSETTASSTVYPILKKTIQQGSNDDDYMNKIGPKIDPLYSCPNHGVFDESKSSSFGNVSIPVNMQYQDGSTVAGNYVTDSVFVGDVEVPDTRFVLNTDSYLAKGVLGVGFPYNEQSFQSGFSKYKNFPLHLKSVGLIKKAIYSIYGTYGKKNSIMFGAYNKNAYVADTGLTLVPIVSYNSGNKIGKGPFYAAITLNSVSFSTTNKQSELIASGNAVAIFDTGSTASSIPYYIFNEILAKFNFKWSSQLGSFVISESEIPKDEFYMTFDFQNAKIKIPLIDFTYPVLDGDTLTATGLRSISIVSSDSDTFLLGDDFLSSVYFVVDIKDKQIALGQANPDFDGDGQIVTVDNRIVDAIQSSNYDQIYGSSGITKLTLATIDDPNKIETMTKSDINLQLYQAGYGTDLRW